MTLVEVGERTDLLLDTLARIWEASVRHTHLFLSQRDIADISPHVIPAIRAVPVLWVARAADGTLCGFMGMDGLTLDMLFIHPKYMGRGIGRQLVERAKSRYGIHEVCVNEQNHGAVEFYRHVGFKVDRRSDHDAQGRPFPLLYMRLETQK